MPAFQDWESVCNVQRELPGRISVCKGSPAVQETASSPGSGRSLGKGNGMYEEKREERERWDEVSLILKSLLSWGVFSRAKGTGELAQQSLRLWSVRNVAQTGSRHSRTRLQLSGKRRGEGEWLEHTGDPRRWPTSAWFFLSPPRSSVTHSASTCRAPRQGQGHPLLRAPRPQQALDLTILLFQKSCGVR